MKISKVQLMRLRNNEHFQFHTEVKNLIVDTTPEAIKVEKLFPAYLAHYQEEDEALKKITKNSFSDLRKDADAVRDKTFSGMSELVNAMLSHFDRAKAEAARRLKIVFDTYGNVARLPLNEETSAINNLLRELQGKRAADVLQIGIQPWAEQLDSNNKAYATLVEQGHDEESDRTERVAKEARTALDTSYRNMVERIDALMVVDGATAYEDFVRKLNVIADRYNNTLSMRLGMIRASKKKDEPN